MPSAKTTIDHDTIRRWVEERGGTPARVKGTETARDPGVLRINVAGYRGMQTLEPIDWDTFFEVFEDNALAFVYQDEPQSRFAKLIARNRMNDDLGEGGATGRSAWRRRGSTPDAVTLLEGQHREIESLFEQLHEAESKRERSELLDELADTLAAHFKVEETLFYPAVCAGDTAEQLHAFVDEHLEVKRAVSKLFELDTADRHFMRELEALEQLVGSHIASEEGGLFVAVRERRRVDIERLGERLEQRFQDLLGSEPRKLIAEEIDAAASLPC